MRFWKSHKYDSAKIFTHCGVLCLVKYLSCLGGEIVQWQVSEIENKYIQVYCMLLQNNIILFGKIWEG